MAKKYVGATTVRALMELIKAELGNTNQDVTELLTTVVKKEDVITDILSYLPPSEGEDGKVVAAAVVKELVETITLITKGVPKTDESGNPVTDKDGNQIYDTTGVAITGADMIKTWDGYDVDADADKVVAAALIKAIKDQVDELSTTISEELDGKKGQPGGIASLDETGKVPAEQLPSYVDDVLEGFLVETADGDSTTRKFYEPNEDGTGASDTEMVGEQGKIYVDLSTNYTYRWSGSTFVRVNEIDLVELTADEVEAIWNEVAATYESKEDVTE